MFKRHWKGLLAKQKRYPRAKFLNEVMARSYDAGTKPITEEEVRGCCNPELSFVDPANVGSWYGAKTWAGIDWGTGAQSYSGISIWGYAPNGAFTLLFAKKYEGIESDEAYMLKDMIQLCAKFNVTRVGADWGFGFYTNDQLKKRLGADKIFLYQHAGKQNAKVNWDKAGLKYVTHRSRVLQDFFTLVKRGRVSQGIQFPRWEESEAFLEDVLCVYSEYSETRREIIFDHPRGVPDDFLHTGVYALLVSQHEHRRPDLHTPGRRG